VKFVNGVISIYPRAGVDPIGEQIFYLVARNTLYD
jgi:hypothetical protein